MKDSPYRNCLYFSTTAFYRLLNQMAELEFGEIGLTPSHAFILMTVNEKKEVHTGEIAKELFLAPSTVTRLIDKLVSMDLVERKSDGKYIRIVATPRGLERDLRIRKAWDNLKVLTGDM